MHTVRIHKRASVINDVHADVTTKDVERHYDGDEVKWAQEKNKAPFANEPILLTPCLLHCKRVPTLGYISAFTEWIT